MDTKHVGIREAEQNTYAHLAVLCRETRFDAAVIGDDAALDFALKYQDTFFPNTPLVFMSAEAFEEDVRRAREAGMDDYLTKPIEPEKLYAVLNRAILQGRQSG